MNLPPSSPGSTLGAGAVKSWCAGGGEVETQRAGGIQPPPCVLQGTCSCYEVGVVGKANVSESSHWDLFQDVLPKNGSALK